MISSDNPNIIIFNVSCEEHMKHRTSVFGQNQIAWKVLVFRIFLDDLLAVHGLQDLTPRDVPSVEAHVDMVGPQYTAAPNALLDESQWIIGHLALGFQLDS